MGKLMKLERSWFKIEVLESKGYIASGTGEVLTTAETEGRAHDQVPGLQ